MSRTPDSAAHPTGTLHMRIGSSAGRAMAVKQYHQGALRIIRPHYLDATDQVCYTIVNPGGGYLGGDHYDIDVSVDPGQRLLLTTQSATKVYRTEEHPARQETRFTLGSGASMEFIPDQLIAYRDARYIQDTVVHMEPDSSLVMAEVLTPGWSPDGKLFRYGEVRLRTEIHVAGRLSVLDNLVVRPGAAGAPVSSMLFLEDYTHLGSLLVVDARVDAGLVAELRALVAPLAGGDQVGISLLNGPGLVLRALSNATEDLNAMISACVDLLRRRWYGQDPMNLRKP